MQPTTVNTASSICFELVKGLPAAFVALVIGLIAAGIAYRQYRVAQAKLNLDLFERRYDIFQATWEHLSAPTGQGVFSSPLYHIIPKASFLFGKDIEAYLKTILSYTNELRMIELKTQARSNVMAPEDISRHAVLTKWFAEEATKGAREHFGVFLDFEEWR